MDESPKDTDYLESVQSVYNQYRFYGVESKKGDTNAKK